MAAGENFHTLAEFNALFAAGGVDMPQPDLTTCGGITPFMKVARLAESHGLPIMSHGAHDLHIHLLGAAPNAAYLEWHAFGLDRYMAEPLTVSEGYATAPERPGHGISFDWDRLGSLPHLAVLFLLGSFAKPMPFVLPARLHQACAQGFPAPEDCARFVDNITHDRPAGLTL